MVKTGIIGGSGLENIKGMVYEGEKVIKTSFGEPSSPYRSYRMGDCLFYVMSRHGIRHNIPPHSVNYRANIAGFKELGVTRIVTFSTVGAINPSYKPGALILLDNAVDFTGGRANTFYDGGDCIHVDLTCPFCGDLRCCVKQAASLKNVGLTDGGVYLCTNGPRLETAAEIKMFASFGADVVGMTMFPEVSLAREAEICYAAVAIVTNPAAGKEEGRRLTVDEILENGAKAAGEARKIISGLAETLVEERSCPCKDALKSSSADK